MFGPLHPVARRHRAMSGHVAGSAGAAKKPATGPPPEARALMAEILRNDDAAIRAAWSIFERFAKLSRDAATITRIAELFRTSRGMPTLAGRLRTFLQSRADAGELRAIVQLLQNNRVKSVRLLEPVQQKGARTPDLEVTLYADFQDPAQNGKEVKLMVEITSVTAAARGVRTRGHTSTNLPPELRGKPEEADRVATPEAILEAVRRKLDRQQALGGLIVVNVPFKTEPELGPADRAAIQQLWANHPHGKGTVREIWWIRPDVKNETRLQVLVSGGLTLASF
jgi:hypothetical protein